MLDYWDKYYKQKEWKTTIPSQFATFCIQDFGNPDETIIFDLGCGDGRDSSFFNSYGFHTIGIDGSIEAINNCKMKHNKDFLEFLCFGIEEEELYKEILKKIDFVNKKVVFYSRFFLHAINEEQQNILLSNLKKIKPKNSICFFEFRTNRDEFQEKSTETHYRRYISPTKFTTDIIKIGFDILYFTEGFGYAKYKNDDAHVARFICK